MKCIICRSPTLPGSKLCKPCRAALRRARDDTVSELMPLPDRLDALAWQHAPMVTRPATVVEVRVSTAATSRVLPAWVDRAAREVGGAPLRSAGVVLIALAVGFLAFVGTHQVRTARQGAGAHAASTAPVSPPYPVVSPAMLAAKAREDAAAQEQAAGSAQEPVGQVSPGAPNSSAPARIRRDAPRTERSRPRAATAVAPEVDPMTAFGPVEQTPAADPSTPPTSSPPLPRLDRWQALSASIARCDGAAHGERGACEHSARVRYCDGYWGHSPLCPNGIPNDHGQ